MQCKGTGCFSKRIVEGDEVEVIGGADKVASGSIDAVFIRAVYSMSRYVAHASTKSSHTLVLQ